MKPISSLILSVLLFIIARVLSMAIVPFSVIFTMIRFMFVKKGVIKINEISRYFWKLAICDDQKGNVACSYIFNHFFWNIPMGGYKSGNPDESISSVVGKNKSAGTLRWPGKVLDWILNKLDPGHSVDAIEQDESQDGYK